MARDTQFLAGSKPFATDGERSLHGRSLALYRTGAMLTYAALRIGFGLILLTHGLPKVFGGAHGSLADPKASATNFIRTVLHFPAPEAFGNFVTLLETGGAIMLALGLFTRIVAPMIAFEMAMICIILSPNWVWLDHGMEYALLMGLVALHIAFRGAGPLSVDRLISSRLRPGAAVAFANAHP